jgi:hypothetical protein
MLIELVAALSITVVRLEQRVAELESERRRTAVTD